MRRLFQFLLKRPLTWLAKFSGSPDKEAVFKSLNRLLRMAGRKGRIIKVLSFDAEKDQFVVFSDQHKGNGDKGDDFRYSEQNYIQALTHYYQSGFSFINLGDSEELWKYQPQQVIDACTAVFKAEAAFQPHQRYIKTFGNHDLLWKDRLTLEKLMGTNFTLPLPVWEAVLLCTTIDGQSLRILLTHGHQGDSLSDNNALSTWLVAHLWAPLQRYLRININTPSSTTTLRNKHNRIMYQWSGMQNNLLLITGHTHQPVFASGFYSDHPANQIDKEAALPLKPTYFNTGCCCFTDGDITGIEISNGDIRLVKWYDEPTGTQRKVLEAISLKQVLADMQ